MSEGGQTCRDTTRENSALLQASSVERQIPDHWDDSLSEEDSASTEDLAVKQPPTHLDEEWKDRTSSESSAPIGNVTSRKTLSPKGNMNPSETFDTSQEHVQNCFPTPRTDTGLQCTPSERCSTLKTSDVSEENSAQGIVSSIDNTSNAQLDASTRTQATSASSAIVCKSPNFQMTLHKERGVFTEENIYRLRLQTMICTVGRDVMHTVFKEGIRDKPKGKSLFDFYKEGGIKAEIFWKNLNEFQKNKVKDNPEGTGFDITLLFLCIQWGAKVTNVADHTSLNWTENKNCLEYCLTEIKKLRNVLMHEDTALHEEKFVDRVKKLQEVLRQTILYAQERYKISDKDVNNVTSVVNEKIKLFRSESMLPLNVNEYMKQNFFMELSEFVHIKGLILLGKLYNSWVYITPVSLFCELKIKVSDVYIEMVLKESTQGNDIQAVIVDYEDLLNGIIYNANDPVILIEGFAGIGKTTLTKKIMNDWVSMHSSMNDLTSYDFLLYTVCRNNTIKSFEELVTSLMPELANFFQGSHLNFFSDVILSRKVIIIVDGLDEFNESSKKLFKQLLELKKFHKITILATTRPERVQTYYDLTESRDITTKHIKLIGIPEGKRKDFVLKYFKEIKNQTKTEQNVSELLDYLTKTARRLSDLWSLPYNLTLLTVLWVYKSKIINYITTAPELHWEIHHLVLDKLFQRLNNREDVDHLHDSDLEEKISNFTYTLCHEALIGLANDEINLSEESFDRLQKACRYEGLPVEEMTGAFLKKIVIITPEGKSSTYSFPHKGVQEFLGALYIYMQTRNLIETHVVTEFLKDLKDILYKHSIPGEIGQDIMRVVSKSLDGNATSTGTPDSEPNKVRAILENLQTNSYLDIKKYQNLLLMTIGLFHLKNISIKDRIKLEILKLLKETGIESEHEWMKILNSVKSDVFVATFITQQRTMIRDTTSVNDSNLFSHISILRVLEYPSEHLPKCLEVTIHEETFGINDLLHEINVKNLIVKQLTFRPEFLRPEVKFMSIDAVNHVFQRGGTEMYMGAFTDKVNLPQSLQSLFISIADKASYEHLHTFLKSYQGKLRLCMPPELDVSGFTPVPKMKIAPNLFLPSVNKDNFSKALDVAKAVQPTGGKIYRLFFPGSKLNGENIKALVKEMKQKNVLVEWGVVFNDCQKPEDSKHLFEFARQEIKRNIRWYDDNFMWNSS